MTTRRQTLSLIAAAAAAGLAPAFVRAADERKLTMLVGFPPGGAPDTVARAIGTAMRSSGYTALVENKAGAGGRIAIDALMAAPADGSTVLLAPAGTLTIYPHIYSNLRIDTIKDLAPIATACDFQFGLAVGPAVPASVKTVTDFVNWCKANPGKAQYGTPGAGTAMHFIAMELGRVSNVPLQHIPYKGGAPALTDAMGGQVSAVFTTLPLLIQPHKGGKVRILAHSGDSRVDSLKDVPTFKESGFQTLTLSEMFVFVASAKTPPAVQKQVAEALNAAIGTPSVKTTLEAAEYNSLTLPQDKIAARLQSEHQRWGQLVKASGFKADS
jgi:tripartite-type tricarboxylate transporter receptor subunit TctC